MTLLFYYLIINLSIPELSIKLLQHPSKIRNHTPAAHLQKQSPRCSQERCLPPHPRPSTNLGLSKWTNIWVDDCLVGKAYDCCVFGRGPGFGENKPKMVKYKREIRSCKFHQSLCEQSRFREVVEGPEIYLALQSTAVVGDIWKLEDVFGAGSCYPLIPQDIPTFKNFWFLVSILFLGCWHMFIISESSITRRYQSHLSHEKTLLTFHCSGCFIRILILAYYNPSIPGKYTPLYNPTN